MKILKFSVPVVLFVAAILVYSSCYIVDERSQAIILQFGRIVGDKVDTPGLKFKKPLNQKPYMVPKNPLEWDGNKGEIPTTRDISQAINTFI